MYLLADKYDIPCLAKFAGRSLTQSLRLSTASSWTGRASEALDPWKVAAYASQCNDATLVDLCMDMVVAPLMMGKDMLASGNPVLPALCIVLMEKVNHIARTYSFVKRT